MTTDRFRMLCCRFGLPDTVVTDNGPAFVGEEFQRFVKKNGIRHITTAPYHPASNGLAERYAREVKCAVKKSSCDKLQLRVSNWLLKQHTTPHCTTGVSPASLMLGRELKTRLHLLHPDVAGHVGSRMDSQKRNYSGSNHLKSILVSDRVFARGYGPGPAWQKGSVVELIGDAMAAVRLNDGRVWRRHFDQLRPAAEPPSTGPSDIPAPTPICDVLPPSRDGLPPSRDGLPPSRDVLPPTPGRVPTDVTSPPPEVEPPPPDTPSERGQVLPPAVVSPPVASALSQPWAEDGFQSWCGQNII